MDWPRVSAAEFSSLGMQIFFGMGVIAERPL